MVELKILIIEKNYFQVGESDDESNESQEESGEEINDDSTDGEQGSGELEQEWTRVDGLSLHLLAREVC